MKTTALKVAILAACAAIVASCSSDKAHYIKAGGQESLLSTHKINMSDWNKVAEKMASDIVSSGILDKLGQPKFYVGEISNRTSDHIETDILTKQISIALRKTGKVRVVADALYRNGSTIKNISAQDIIMTGTIIENRDTVDGVREVTYVFNAQLSRNGEVIWEEMQQIAKQTD